MLRNKTLAMVLGAVLLMLLGYTAFSNMNEAYKARTEAMKTYYKSLKPMNCNAPALWESMNRNANTCEVTRSA